VALPGFIFNSSKRAGSFFSNQLPLTVAFIVWFWVTVVVAGGGGLSAEVIEWIKNEYGHTGVDRLYAWQRLIAKNQDKSEQEKLNLVNDFFNMLTYSTDKRLWGKSDYWATPVEALGKGGADCEDYSIAKYFTLQEMGIPEEKMRITYVKALKLNEHHMVLTYYPAPDAVPLVLDNLNGDILSASERNDLTPIYSFNGDGLWLAKSRESGQRMGSSNRIKLWQDLTTRMKKGVAK